MTDPAVESEVRRLLYGYARALDRLDADLLASVFHADAAVEMGTIYRGGRDGFIDVAMAFMGSMAATRHDIANILIAADGDGATAESYVTAWHRIDTPEGVRELTVLGRYLSRIDRRDGIWAIAWQSEIIDWGRDVPSDAGWYERNTEMPKGTRGRSDGSYRIVG